MFQIKNKLEIKRYLTHKLKQKKILVLTPSWLMFSFKYMLGFILSAPKTFRYPYNSTKTISSFIGAARYY